MLRPAPAHRERRTGPKFPEQLPPPGQQVDHAAEDGAVEIFSEVTAEMDRKLAEREGFEPDSGSESDQQLAESESNPIPNDPRKSP